MSLQKLIPNFIATLFCWVSIGLVVAVTPPGAFIRDLVIVIAFLATVALWMTWAFVSYGTDNATVSSEKGKRQAGNNANLALLLELLDDDERHEIKQRLLNNIQSDGETSPLSELLSEQETQSRQSAS